MAPPKRIGVVTAISGPYPTQSTASLLEFIEEMRTGHQNAATQAEKMIEDRKAGREKEPENGYP